MKSYIYMTTNLVNGKKYIGRKTSEFFDENYYGSGTHLKNALKKYGKENFSIKLIEALDTKEEAIEREQYWIKYYNAVEDDNFYNISYGGPNEGWVKGDDNIAKTDWCRKLNSEKHKGKKYSKETVEKRKQTINERYGPESEKGYTEIMEKRKQTTLDKYGVECYCQTEEFKQAQSQRSTEYNLLYKDYNKISEKTKGKKFMHKDGVQTWVMRNDIEAYLADGWEFGSCKKRNRDYSNPWNKGLKMSKK